MSSSRLRRTGLALLVVIGLALVVSGCGGSSGSGGRKVTATAYVTSLCHAFRPFVSDISSREQALASGVHRTPASGRTALVDFLSGLAADADSAHARVVAAGTPSVAHGQEIASRLAAVFAHVAASLRAAEAQARKLPVSSPAAFSQAAAGLKTTMSSSVGGAMAGMSGISTGPLDQAAQKVPACHGVG